MPRINAPEPTRGSSPSFSPPDVRYAPGLGLSRALGWFSIGLGLAEMLAPRAMAELTGVRHPAVLQGYGLREFACGVGILTSDRPVGWMCARVAGDALDLATLGEAWVEAKDNRRERVLLSTAAVAGVTLLDVLCSTQLGAAAAVEGYNPAS